MRSINQIVRFGLPDDYWNNYADRVNALGVGDVEQSALNFIKPDQIVWVVVGDAAKIREGLDELSFDEIRMITADGDLLTGE
jgi:zinc protease